MTGKYCDTWHVRGQEPEIEWLWTRVGCPRLIGQAWPRGHLRVMQPRACTSEDERRSGSRSRQTHSRTGSMLTSRSVASRWRILAQTLLMAPGRIPSMSRCPNLSQRKLNLDSTLFRICLCISWMCGSVVKISQAGVHQMSTVIKTLFRTHVSPWNLRFYAFFTRNKLLFQMKAEMAWSCCQVPRYFTWGIRLRNLKDTQSSPFNHFCSSRISCSPYRILLYLMSRTYLTCKEVYFPFGPQVVEIHCFHGYFASCEDFIHHCNNV